MKKYGQCSNLSTYVQGIILQKPINLPTANMGSRPSKRKYNKEGHKQKLSQDKIKYLSDPKASLKLHYWNI